LYTISPLNKFKGNRNKGNAIKTKLKKKITIGFFNCVRI
jgi:hypothetical protein